MMEKCVWLLAGVKNCKDLELQLNKLMPLSIGLTYNDSESHNKLRGLYHPIVSQLYCNEQYNGRVSDRIVCAGYDEGGKGFCQGDSGGPLVKFDEDGHNPSLIGVVSWRKFCGESKFPDIYARVTSVRSWIKEVTNI